MTMENSIADSFWLPFLFMLIVKNNTEEERERKNEEDGNVIRA